jgi:signal transduction histidine kinase
MFLLFPLPRLDEQPWVHADCSGAADRFPMGRKDSPVPAEDQTVATFWTLCGAGFAAGAFGIHTLRVKVLRRIQRLEQQHALEEERARIAHEIHDDMGACLTQISLLTELAQRSLANNSEASGYIRRIGFTATDLFRRMDEIVWAVNPRHDTLGSLMDYVCRYSEQYLRLAEIRCRLDLPERIPHRCLSSEIRHNIFLSVKEALNNVVKHAHPSEVWIRVRVDRNGFELHIEDNGGGFQTAKADPMRHGLSSMRQRLTKAGGRLEVESKPNEGTKIRMFLPCPS